MWTSLSASRWICLLTLAAVMLFFASEADSQTMSLSCCKRRIYRKVPIENCYEQKSRYGCRYHAFVVKTTKNRELCIRPDAQWLKDEIERGLPCPPSISQPRFEVLDEDDME